MTNPLRPLLAATLENISSVRYPILVSPKLDGVRCIVQGNRAVSRNGKLIPNPRVHQLVSQYEGHDGELIVGDPYAPDAYRRTMSAVMSQDGDCGGLNFWVFDTVLHPTTPYSKRFGLLRSGPGVQVVDQALVEEEKRLLHFEEIWLAKGYEGVMLRAPGGLYKNGRSTLNEGTLIKLKRFTDGEATVIGKEPWYTNNNEAKPNELGFTKRSSHKENKVAQPMLGALVVDWFGKTFNIGSGFTHADREALWNDPNLIGKVVKFKFLQVGMKDLPRHPVFIGFRQGD